ncbi:MAG: hypothetical protein ACOX6Y_05485 [Christensenellales bacterium]|jgi:hypothetical protein
MNKKTAKWLSMLMAVLLILPWSTLAGDPWANVRWRVNISFDLNGGQWPEGKTLGPASITAKPGKSMPHSALEKVRNTIPVKAGSDFRGWSVRFTNPKDGKVIFDSGEEIWDLNHPFDYYPDNPLTMHCLMTARWRVPAKPVSDLWKVHVSHDLNGGSWPDGLALSPHTITAKTGNPMPINGLEGEMLVKPFRAESVFLGWSVLFTDPNNGKIIHDGRSYIWNLSKPFDYYPDNPKVMNCLMIANWQPAQSGGSSSLPTDTLPDGRVITWPFAAGTEPLPEIPPPADQVIPGTAWLRGALICGIDEGTKVPVYAFPVYNGPIMDWVGLDDRMDYGMYLQFGDAVWVMLYHPKWVENAGIGFIAADAVAFPGAEE